MTGYAQRSYTSVDGLALAARDYPAASGPARLPVICIHGLTRNAADFDELAPLLARQSRRVLALDVRGRGESARDPNPANYNPVTYAGDVAKLMQDLGIARAVFVGTSMGGLITMTLAMRNLDLVAAAVLNDIGPVMSRAGLERIAGYAGKTCQVGTWEEAATYVKGINQGAFRRTRTTSGTSGRAAPLPRSRMARWRCATTRTSPPACRKASCAPRR